MPEAAQPANRTTETDNRTSANRVPVVFCNVRTLLLGIVVFGIVGTSTELTLLGHFAEPAQSAPLVVLASCLAVTIWHLLAPTATSVRVMRIVMTLLIVTSVVGVGFHFVGNLEFKQELYPELEGLELFLESVTGVTPVFAPGSMLLLGLIGLTSTLRHPRVAWSQPERTSEEADRRLTA